MYNVHRGDLNGFVSAVQGALNHPIDSYVLERMRVEEVEKRMQEFVEGNWKAQAKALLESGDFKGTVSRQDVSFSV